MKNFFTTVVVLFASALLVHAAGKTAIKSPLFQGDADAGGNNITNVVDILDPNGNSLLGGGGGGGISTTTATNIAKDLISKSNLNVTVPEISAATNAVVSSLGSSAFVNTNRFAQTNNPTIFSANLRSAVIPDVLTLQSGSSLNFSDGQPIITAGGYIMWGNGTRAQSEFGSRLWYGGGSFQSGQGDLWDFTGYEFMYPDGSVDFTHGSTNVFAGDGTALTLATNNSTASDGWLLSKTGNHYKLIASAAGGSWTGALGNWQVWTNTDGSLYFSNTVGGVSFVIPTNGLPVTTNYPQLSTNFNWSQGQIAVFSGQTNSVTGSPIFVPTNMPTGGGGGTIAGMITSNYLAQTTNAFVWDLSQVQRQVIQFNTNINAVVFSNAWALTNRENEWHTWEDTNGTWSISSLKANGGLVRTNGAFWRGTNANQYDMATLRLDGTGTNVIVTFGATNIQPAISFTNSLAGGGGGGGGCGVTMAQGDVVNQDFSGASVPSGWASSADATLAYGASNPNSTPCQLTNKVLHASWSGTGVPYSYWDRGSYSCATYYFRFYFYVGSSSMGTGTGNFIDIFDADEGVAGNGNDFRACLIQQATSSSLGFFVQFAGGAISPTNNISTGGWYRGEIQYVNSGAVAAKLYDASGTQIGTTYTGTSANNKCFRFISTGVVGHNNTFSADVYITGVGVSSTGFLGP